MPADPGSFALLAALVLAAAILYSAVGHAGASAYLAAMALFGVHPAAMKPAALVMNIVVASAGTARWWSAGLVPWNLLWPLCTGSVPAAFAGGAVVLPADVYRRVLAVILLGAALRLWFPARARQLRPVPGPRVLVALGAASGSSPASPASAAASSSRR